jgi:pimeloyl-ACP methyl ester carboxylesterase
MTQHAQDWTLPRRTTTRHGEIAYDVLGAGPPAVLVRAQVLSELTTQWQLDRPALVGHDVGAAVLRAHLLEGVAVGRLALLDAVALRPWITPASRHVKANLDAYTTMPNEVFSEVTGAHLRRTVSRHDEQHTADFEELLPTIAVPTLIV